MPNIRVRQALERLRREINQVGQHIVQHSGIDKKDAMVCDDLATDIAVTAAQIAEISRQAGGTSRKPGSLVRETRRALGFTIP